MADKLELQITKGILIKSTTLGLILLATLYIAPIEQLRPFQNLDFHIVIYSYLLVFSGLIMFVEFMRNLPDTEKSMSAKTGAYIFLVVSIVSFVYGGGIFIGVYDPTTDVSSFATVLTVVLGFTFILLFAGLLSELHNRKTLANFLSRL